ncbi:MAG: RNA 2',3'-cyclic phosphodiesterase [Pseudomonadales bacterium]|nr:RNA 2',3'-cyclic phosphodiesterase [Pseudomonadales bacterium]MCP5185450.1 RNA 2',3'-cyclic phosphodiesterase [Pseudomonadales bacterium]
MRLFFGLDPDPATRRAIDTWRNALTGVTGKRVPTANLHLTLLFLGQVAPDRLTALRNAADRIPCRPFSLVLDEVGYWRKPRVLWLGARDVPTPALRLAQALRATALAQALPLDDRAWRPHVTLYRSCHGLPDDLPGNPRIEAVFNGFTLYQSRSTDHGVHYDPLAVWH